MYFFWRQAKRLYECAIIFTPFALQNIWYLSFKTQNTQVYSLDANFQFLSDNNVLYYFCKACYFVATYSDAKLRINKAHFV